jgi:hypothetical protein
MAGRGTHLVVDLRRIAENARRIVEMCGRHGVEVLGVTKGFSAEPNIVSANAGRRDHQAGGRPPEKRDPAAAARFHAADHAAPQSPCSARRITSSHCATAA